MKRNVRRALRASSTGRCDGLIALIILVVCVVVIYSFLFDKGDADNDSNAVLYAAAENCELETVKSLVKNNANTKDSLHIGEIALRSAAGKGCLEVVKFLLDEGVDINTSLALFGAASSGQLEVVKLLLERGADPHVRGWKGATPKIIAIKRSSYRGSNRPYDEIIDLLDQAEKQYKSEQ